MIGRRKRSDAEMAARVRRVLRAEAEAVTPGRVVEGGAIFNMPAARPARSRRRLYGAFAAGVAVAAAAGAAVAVLVPSSGRPEQTIVPAGTNGTAGAPATVGSGAASTVAPPVTVPLSPVPSGFEPASVTFYLTNEGWAVGLAPCSGGECLTLLRTTDEGSAWDAVPAPAVSWTSAESSAAIAGLIVRFADANDGWMIVPSCAAGSCSGYDELWSTHDGGATWTQVSLPGGAAGGVELAAMETANGRVWVAAYEQGYVEMYGSLVTADDFVVSNPGVPIGAGPVPSTELVLHGSSGWLVQDDRTVVGGAELNGSGTWKAWSSPPCRGANGAAGLAVSASTSGSVELAAICQEGVWGPPNPPPPGYASSSPPPTWLYSSSDGGATFQAVDQLPSQDQWGGVIASPTPGTSLVAGSTGIIARFGNAIGWTGVYHLSAGGDVAYIGFTTADQGVAIVSSGARTSTLLMTRDGGHTWVPVSFSAG